MEGEGCCGWEPPPDSILVIPPPPLPAFLQLQPPAPNVTTDPCLTAPLDLCTAPPGRRGLEFVELPRHGIDDTWLLVLISCSIGVLLLGSLLALLLLKCREERGRKGEMEREGETSKNGVVGSRCEAVLYPRLDASSRVLWATLTPRGTTTHRFCCPNNNNNNNNSSSNNNYGRVDPFYLEPEPVYAEPDEYLMKVRPRVSSPTRIENPNLPPLNLHRHTLSRRFPYEHPPLL